jgi:exonuclease III
MKILCWNCHGLGNAAAVRALLDVMRRYNPDVVFLSQTHLEDYLSECLKRKAKMDFKIVQDYDGRREGILMFWKREVKLYQIRAEPNFIDVRIEEDANKVWRFTAMYVEFKLEEKYKTWDIICSIHQNNSLPWVVMGDLNEILFDQEKEWGASDPQGICRISIMRLMIVTHMTWVICRGSFYMA